MHAHAYKINAQQARAEQTYEGPKFWGGGGCGLYAWIEGTKLCALIARLYHYWSLV